jgi:hypothetical protein
MAGKIANGTNAEGVQQMLLVSGGNAFQSVYVQVDEIRRGLQMVATHKQTIKTSLRHPDLPPAVPGFIKAQGQI